MTHAEESQPADSADSTAEPGESGPLVLDAAATSAALADAAALTAALRRALIAVARGKASVPARIAAHAPNGLLGAMPGYVPGLGLAAKLITVFDDPRHPGRSTHRGLVAAFDEHDGRLLAVLDAKPLTAIRTAATSILAFRVLARPDARRVAVIGTGALATAHLHRLARDRTLALTVAGRDPQRARALSRRFGASSSASIEDAVRAADAVFCCTGASEPVIRRDWLAPRTHVSSVGGSQGPELDAATVAEAELFAEWQGAYASPPPAGAHELQGVDPARVTLLGTVLADEHRTHEGRRPRHSRGLTVFKSTGHAALDVAAAHVAVTHLPPSRRAST